MNAGNSSLTIERCTLSGNTSISRGGGLFISGSGSMGIWNSTLSGNIANSSGGLEINNFGGPATIRNSTITANTLSGSGVGSGLSIVTTSSPVELISTVVAGNSPGNDLHASSMVLLGNSATGSISALTPITDLGGNLPTGLDPKLAPLADNGGPVKTHALLNGSPLLNAGANPGGLATDARGLPRAISTATDIGAFEFQGTSFIVNNRATQRSRITSLTVFFVSPVEAATLIGTGAIKFTRTAATNTGTVGTVVDTGNGLLVSPVSGLVNSVTLTFANVLTAGIDHASLADGYWQLSVSPIGFTSNPGDPALRRLFGDINGDGTVDGPNDFAQFGSVFGTTAAGNPFDFNNDGTIDGTNDFAAFGNRFGVTL